jgi:hypothetical protein
MAGTHDRRRLTLAGDHDRNVVAIALNTAELDLVRRAIRQLVSPLGSQVAGLCVGLRNHRRFVEVTRRTGTPLWPQQQPGSCRPEACLSLGDQISVFYEDFDENVIRHAYKRPGLPWMMEVVDGDTAFDSRVRSTLSRPAAVMRGGFLNLIYFDNDRQVLRHAVLSR